MNSTNRVKLQSVLVALVNLPANEEAPPLEKDLLTNPHNTIISLKDSGGHEKFLQLYQDAHTEFTKRYNSQERNLIVTPKGTAADASAERNNEDGNTAVSVNPEKLLKTWDVKAILGDDNPAATAQDASAGANNEPDNTAVSVNTEELVKKSDVKAIVEDDNPAATAQAAYGARSNGDMDVYSWAEYLCKIC
ncbi:MAG TPA: hypothetical protein IGS52_20240 [Oscillatoriaceae cyanobacterium M33_DOE_052]|nr:hypothetical protein [Oscillatoriaceae cyanobacterium M33_DOE_052]